MPRIPGLLERIQRPVFDRLSSPVARAAVGVGAAGVLVATGALLLPQLAPPGPGSPAQSAAGSATRPAATIWPLTLSTSLDLADDPYGPYHLAFTYSFAAPPGSAFPGFIVSSGVVGSGGQAAADSTATVLPGIAPNGSGFLTIPSLPVGGYTVNTLAIGMSGTALTGTSASPLAAPTPVAPDVLSLTADLRVPVTTYAVTAKDPAGKDLTYSWRMTGEACGTPLVPWTQSGTAVARWSHSGNAPDNCQHAGTDHDVTTVVTITTARGVSVVCTIKGSEDLLIPYPICPSALTVPLTVTTSTGSGSGLGTGTFTAVGAPTETTIGSNKAVQTTFTNNSGSSATAIVYAVVHNSAGQTVAYSTATLTNVPGGATATAYNVLIGLAPGTYSVTVFATSMNGSALSGTSTVTATIP